jgi:1-acyl-sn-glycerol-3-phosphate acyltransferase
MELGSMLVYEGLRFFLGPFFSFHFRVRSEGVCNVPEEGAAIVVANHRCYLDPLVLGHEIPRFINFAAGSHLFGFPGAKYVLGLPGFFSLNIYGGTDSDRDLGYASRLLSRGELVGIFPEGIESFMHLYQVSKISNFKTGFVMVALDNRVPIIPAAIVPAEEKELIKLPAPLVTPFVDHPAAKDGVQLITYRNVTCRVGRPIDLSPFYKETRSKYLIDLISGRIRRIIIKLYDGDDLDKLMTGETPFDFAKDPI